MMNYLLVMVLVGMYQVGRVSLGLAVHPYQTMREVVRKWWLWPVAGVPMGLLVMGLIVARVAAWLVDVPELFRGVIAGGLAIGAIGLVLWQLVVGYLGMRFLKARIGS